MDALLFGIFSVKEGCQGMKPLPPRPQGKHLITKLIVQRKQWQCTLPHRSLNQHTRWRGYINAPGPNKDLAFSCTDMLSICTQRHLLLQFSHKSPRIVMDVAKNLRDWNAFFPSNVQTIELFDQCFLLKSTDQTIWCKIFQLIYKTLD